MRWSTLPWLLLAACSTPATPLPLDVDLPVPRALNDRALPIRAADAPFRFLLAGHIYGDPYETSMPSGTFLAATPELSRSCADLMLCLGDTFRIGVPECFDRTQAALRRLPFPTFNAVGNHDVTRRDEYTARFGPTFGAFVHGGCLFVVLDTELQTWEIAGPQLDFLRAALQAATVRSDLRAVFCCAHKLVFGHRQRYFEVLMGGNALDDLKGPNRFCQDVLPLLQPLAQRLPVYWFGGDIGTQRTLPAFLDRDPTSGVTFAAAGIGDLPRDCVLQVDVAGREVRLSLRSLTGAPVPDLADLGVAAWRQHVFPDGLPEHLAKLKASLPP